mmetsp:Transcript_17102/g.50177  ORF Transcript_17102/g.50177 Transcript_17102/m.50177 type:complete len:462 (-) Transcript_17102:828-2213(-)
MRIQPLLLLLLIRRYKKLSRHRCHGCLGRRRRRRRHLHRPCHRHHGVCLLMPPARSTCRWQGLCGGRCGGDGGRSRKETPGPRGGDSGGGGGGGGGVGCGGGGSGDRAQLLRLTLVPWAGRSRSRRRQLERLLEELIAPPLLLAPLLGASLDGRLDGARVGQRRPHRRAVLVRDPAQASVSLLRVVLLKEALQLAQRRAPHRLGLFRGAVLAEDALHHVVVIHGALPLEQSYRLARARRPRRRHKRDGVAEHARHARRAVEDGHGAQPDLHHRQQLGHHVRRRRDLDRVVAGGIAHGLARQLVDEVEVHRLASNEVAQPLLDCLEGVADLASRQVRADGLQPAEPLHAGVERVHVLATRDCRVPREGDGEVVVAKRHAAAVGGDLQQLRLLLLVERLRQLLEHHDEGSGYRHLRRLEDALEQHVARAPQLALVLDAELHDDDEHLRLLALLLALPRLLLLD